MVNRKNVARAISQQRRTRVSIERAAGTGKTFIALHFGLIRDKGSNEAQSREEAEESRFSR